MICDWHKIKGKIREQVPDHCFKMWIDPVEFRDAADGTVSLSCPNDFFVKRIGSRYLPVLEQAFEASGLPGVRICLQARSAPRPGRPGPARTDPSPVPRKEQLTLPGMSRRGRPARLMKAGHTFDDFVVGNNSKFAYSAALSLAGDQASGFNMLYLLSGTGLGKSHLARAAGRHILDRSGSSRVLYVTAEDFTNEMVSALKHGGIDSFKERYRRQCDVLILEDVHFLSGKGGTQAELARTLDYLVDGDRKIIFSGSMAPDEIPGLDAQVRSRLAGGLVAVIERPDYATRIRILQKKSLKAGCRVPDDVVSFLAREIRDDVRRMESGLFTVAAKASFMSRPVDLALAAEVVAVMGAGRDRVSVDAIKRLVCREFSITGEQIVSGSRKQGIARPRQIGIWLAHRFTDLPIKQIGRAFGRYHATAIYSVNAVEKLLAQKGRVFEQVRYLSGKIEKGDF